MKASPDPDGRAARRDADDDLVRMTCRGEFKTPGGKLIAVDFNVVDDELRNVVVTGDFFLYPEEALPILAGALENSPVTLDEAGYAERVRTALDGSAELVGSSPEALAVAVVRGLQARQAPELGNRG